jgi:hypothetical protein
VRIVSHLPPTIVRSRSDVAGILQGLRYAAKLTGEEMDDIAGFSDRYTAKLEAGGAPQGRRGFIIQPGRISMSPMAEIWLDTLGVSLVLMTTDQAAEIGAVECDRTPRQKPPPSWRKFPKAAPVDLDQTGELSPSRR